MVERVFNFSPGPATLPPPVIERVREAIIDFGGTGIGVMECSHRSKQFDAAHEETKSLLLELIGAPEGFEVIFLGGGASMQFAMIPMNLLGPDKVADYVVTGTWAKNAVKEAKRFGQVNIAASTEVDGVFRRVPGLSELKLDPKAAYVHMTSNNTIFCTQFPDYPDTGEVPLLCDMSSDILSRPVDVSKFDYIYAGAQKNLGPAGLCVGLIRKSLLERCNADVPTMLSYKTYVEKNSLFNTPPVFAIYTVLEVLRWVKGEGGVAAMARLNEAKGELLYGLIDEQPDFFRAPVEKDSRSLMTVAFRLPSEELEKLFLAEAGAAGLAGLKGHRSVGGVRVSMYNAMPLEGIEKLTGFMRDFARKHG